MKQVDTALITINLWLFYCFKHIKDGTFSFLKVDSLTDTNSLLHLHESSQTSRGVSKNVTLRVNCTSYFCLIFKTLKGRTTISDSSEGFRGTIYEIALEVQFANETFASAGKIHSQKDAGCLCVMDLT